MARRSSSRGKAGQATGGKVGRSAGPAKSLGPGTPPHPAESVSLAEAATLLGVGQDVLIEALQDHGLSAAEAAEARLLTFELDAFRARLQGSDERVQTQLAALRSEFDDA